MQAATLASGTLAMSGLAFAQGVLLLFAMGFACFVVFRIAQRTKVTTVRRYGDRLGLVPAPAPPALTSTSTKD